MITMKIIDVYWKCKDQGDFLSEKTEIIERRNYLTSKLVTTPHDVLNEMPLGIGEQFKGEWALYSCSMLSAALVNISRIYPETKEANLEQIDSLIQIVNTPRLRKYDTDRWGEDAIKSLPSNKSHVSYISHLAWMISGYKALGGDEKYDDLYSALCEAMNRRILNSPSMNLETYPNEPIYIPDMLVAIVALNQYAKQHNGKYATTVKSWIRKAKKEWCDKETGLLVSFLDEKGNQIPNAPIKGSYSSLNCSYLTMIDGEFAREQYQLLKNSFWKNGLLMGMKEYADTSPIFSLDIDAGPIIMGLSPSGTAFATGAVTYFQDMNLRNDILKTAEIVGQTIKNGNGRHYALANIAIVGEAIMLAMRTNVDNARVVNTL